MRYEKVFTKYKKIYHYRTLHSESKLRTKIVFITVINLTARYIDILIYWSIFRYSSCSYILNQKLPKKQYYKITEIIVLGIYSL